MQVKCNCLYSYNYAISYLQLLYLMWFSLEIAPYSIPFLGYSRISQVKSMKNTLKYSKLDKCFWQECREVCFWSHKCEILYMRWGCLVWFSFVVAPCRYQFLRLSRQIRDQKTRKCYTFSSFSFSNLFKHREQFSNSMLNMSAKLQQNPSSHFPEKLK